MLTSWFKTFDSKQKHWKHRKTKKVAFATEMAENADTHKPV